MSYFFKIQTFFKIQFDFKMESNEETATAIVASLLVKRIQKKIRVGKTLTG